MDLMETGLICENVAHPFCSQHNTDFVLLNNCHELCVSEPHVEGVAQVTAEIFRFEPAWPAIPCGAACQ